MVTAEVFQKLRPLLYKMHIKTHANRNNSIYIYHEQKSNAGSDTFHLVIPQMKRCIGETIINSPNKGNIAQTHQYMNLI